MDYLKELEKKYGNKVGNKVGNLRGGFLALAAASNAQDILSGMKGGKSKMETKSRYEVISELEGQKRTYIRERDNLKDNLKEKQRELKELKREFEDAEEIVKEFKDSLPEKEKTINTLIKSIDDSLARFAKLQEKK